MHVLYKVVLVELPLDLSHNALATLFSECEDKNGMSTSCATWKMLNQCNNGDVVKQCAKTCGKCGEGQYNCSHKL